MKRLALLACIAAAGPAAADWQGVPFGVSMDELPAYVPGVVVNEDRSRDGIWAALMTAPYLAQDIEMDAFFLFDREGRLRQVRLEPREGMNCSLVASRVSDAYGEPEAVEETTSTLITSQFRDERNRNLVLLQHPPGVVPSECAVLYRPILTGGDPGGL